MWELPDSMIDYYSKYLKDSNRKLAEYTNYTFNLIDKVSDYAYEPMTFNYEPMVFDHFELISPPKVKTVKRIISENDPYGEENWNN